MLFETQWLFLLLQQFWRLDAMAQGAATLLGSGTLWFGVWMLSDEYGQSFAWFAATIYAGQIIELPLKWQWHVAKSIRDRALERLESRE